MAEVLEALPDDARERRLRELARHLLDARPLVDAAAAASAALARRPAGDARAGLRGRRRAPRARPRGRPRRARSGCGRRSCSRSATPGCARATAPAADGRFREAADAGRALGDAELLARAALGRAGLDRERRARPRRGPRAARGGPRRRARRRRRCGRGCSRAWRSSSTTSRPSTLRERLSAEALAAGRRAGGPALLEALGARHVALWSPAHTEERLAIADELVAAARAAGDREAELQGINWRVADLFELGDRDAAAGGDRRPRAPGRRAAPARLRLVRAAVAGDARAPRRAPRRGAAAVGGGRAHRPRSRTTTTPALLFGVQRRAIRMSPAAT